MRISNELKRDFSLALIFAFFGFVFTTHIFLGFLDALNPLFGFIVYYIIIYSALIALSHLGLVAAGIRIRHPLQTFGLLLITFAFFIIVDWESPYINLATKGTDANVTQIYFQSEDGVVWFLWSFALNIIHMQNLLITRLLTYVFTPFVLAFMGGFLLEERPRILA